MKEDNSNTEIKKLYNNIINKKYNKNYEFQRWFSNARLRLDYFMTYKSIQNATEDVNFNRCLELGPGPGTWTRVLYRKNSDANFDLVDISQEMKNQFYLEMRANHNINYLISDIMEFNTEKKYDFFFSSRAIEYLEDKKILMQKIYSILLKNGTGIIITKNPQIGLLRKKRKKWQHTNQIEIENFKILLTDIGFNNIEFYPVIVRIPLIERISSKFSENLYARIYKKQLKKKYIPMIESYLIKFKK